ncbi:MAG: type I 3-dehydroquinate dehydratase [Candidatus Firestonebacteria bacterium]|nr:type I 3-dehydroquinate dehydratase [Candidatus Firestonebacteria bacterium]
MGKIKIGNIKLADRTVVVGTIVDFDISFFNNVEDDILKKIDILELRIDLLNKISLNYIKSIIHIIKASLKKPVIATIRSKKEGSRRNINDKTRYNIFKNIIQDVDCVDIEINSGLFNKVTELSHFYKKPVIGSYHNFNKTPSDIELNKILLKGKKGKADIVKIACFSLKTSDLIRLTQFTINHNSENIVTILMGSTGTITRIFYPLIGSLFTYGFLTKNSSPGQLSAKEIINYLQCFDLKGLH